MPKVLGHFSDISAAADFFGPGALEINRFQSEMVDKVRRRFAFGQRISQTPATGQPSRWFEELAIGNAAFQDPRLIQAVASQPTRAERVISLKALTAQINYSMFDVEVTQQQGQFAYLEAKDLSDTVDSVLKAHDQALWTGNDTDALVPTSLQYFGVLAQIANATALNNVSPTFNIAATGSIVDATKTEVATMVSRTDFEVKPTAIYSNPLFLDLIDQEAKKFQLYFNKVEILPGVVVQGIPTQMGILPLIPDPSIPLVTAGVVGARTFQIVLMEEDLVEYHWLTNPLPRVFQLGLLGNLAAQYVIVKFGAVAVKARAYAHAIGYAANR
jgi:hypothetical protein